MDISNKIKEEIIRSFMGVKCESNGVDFKEFYHFKKEKDKLEVIKDIVSFANTKGGYIIYGVSDKFFEWVGLNDESDELDDIAIKNELKKYIKEDINFVAGQIDIDDNVFYIIYIDKYQSNELISFTEDGCYVSRNKNGKEERKFVFRKYSIYGREGTSNLPINDNLSRFKTYRNCNGSIITNLRKYTCPFNQFVERKNIFNDFLNKFIQEKSDVIQIKGLGGIGKTSFIYNFCEKLLNNEIEQFNNYFQYIIWITGKMTLFQPSGKIINIKNEEISFEEFINYFNEVFNVDGDNIESKVKDIIYTLENYKCLIVIDNMETINNTEINDFLLKIPKNTKTIITSRENLENMTSPIVNIIGFDKKEFKTYFRQQLKIFGESDSNIENYLLNDEIIDKLLEYTYGSPLIINMISYQIATGGNLTSVLELFSSKQKIELELYDKVMEFCFNETFSKLNEIDRSILYILSIPQSNDKKFKTDDIAFILKEKKSLVQDTISKLVKLSFVLKDDNLYYSPPLVKIFSNHKLSNSDIDTYNLGLKYAELNRYNNEFDEKQENYFDLTKAYTEQEKFVALKMKEIINDFRLTNNVVVAKKELDVLIKELPNFARLYYEYSQILEDAQEDENLIRKYFDLAVEKDTKNDFFWVKYANFELSRSKQNSKNREKAINYFKNALTINEMNYHANHGLAVALSRNYQSNPTEEIYNEIVNYFNKGFSPDGLNKNFDNVNAHAYAHFLYINKKYEEALVICENQTKKSGGSKELDALEGIIQKNIDPTFIGQKKIKKYKRGILSNQDDSIIKRLIGIIENNN